MFSTRATWCINGMVKAWILILLYGFCSMPVPVQYWFLIMMLVYNLVFTVRLIVCEHIIHFCAPHNWTRLFVRYRRHYQWAIHLYLIVQLSNHCNMLFFRIRGHLVRIWRIRGHLVRIRRTKKMMWGNPLGLRIWTILELVMQKGAPVACFGFWSPALSLWNSSIIIRNLSEQNLV